MKMFKENIEKFKIFFVIKIISLKNIYKKNLFKIIWFII